ncbi:hypothetical protein ACLIMP_06180 [Novosphingobium aerophilum]|uniref:hypothetical protein n=1 Tax=Novosphingobium TaxID=165696 RepID=UPI0006C8E0F3|nr:MULTISPECIES: hypothetical protein [unclassified Novosphingobium]KPH65800.1 hypothetical protein ADT71_09710 [Novosphingobium sp. ST904]MPS71332.1 hypothetical protein [Novosphingobium sp.]TCM29084.1 hypothetical protein EDF59_12819 [Novosphingobium sp. ST904]WRT93826.1 hypothetical protein U9J33_04725 [Novosphingobium sp. RL4]
MQDQSWKIFTGATFLLLVFAVIPKAWSQDPAPPAVSSGADARDKVVEVCMAEAKARGEKQGAVDVAIRKVEDTDKKSDGRASLRAEVDVTTREKDGKIKTTQKTIKCDTRDGVITGFKY